MEYNRVYEATVLYVLSCQVVTGAIQKLDVDVVEVYSSSNKQYPELVVYNVTLDHDSIVLRLLRTTLISVSPSVYVLKDGAIVPHEKNHRQEYATYQDSENDASMTVFSSKFVGGKWQRHLAGTFIKGNRHMSLFRADDIIHTEDETSSTGPNNYKLEVVTPYTPTNRTSTDEPSPHTRLQKRVKRQLDDAQHFIELLLVIDNSLYRRWYNKTNVTKTQSQRENEALKKMEIYYAQIANGINLWYRNLKRHSLKLEVVLSAIYIAKTRKESLWTESMDTLSVIPGRARRLLDAGNSLNHLVTWINNKNVTASLPRFDHAMLLTGYDLWDLMMVAGDEVAGMAMINKMCFRESVSIVEDPGGFVAIPSCVHELAHSLGAYHDGLPYNFCNSRDRYVMSATQGLATSDNYKRKFTFSPCSIRSMKHFIGILNNRKMNCLLDKATHLNNATHFRQLTSVMPGQMYTVHEQCKDLLGPESYYTAGLSEQGDICWKMYCFDPVRKRVIQRSWLVARGTTCGDKKWCIEGDCVYDSQAPRAAATCVYGDQIGILYSNSNYTCQSAHNVPSLCYIESFQDKCCRTCGARYDNCSIKTCQYGDRISTCGSEDCLDDSKLEQCCRFCEERFVAYSGQDLDAIKRCREQANATHNTTTAPSSSMPKSSTRTTDAPENSATRANLAAMTYISISVFFRSLTTSYCKL